MNSFKVVKAYLAKKAQEPIPDSPERRKALEELEYSPQLAPHYLSKGLITKEEALPFALEVLKVHPRYVVLYFKEGLLTREEALPFALERLKKNLSFVLEYLEYGLITKEEAHPFALERLKQDPYHVASYFTEGIITKEEALPFVLDQLKIDSSRLLMFFKEGLITKEEALPFVLEILKKQPAYVGYYFKEELLTKEEALPFVLEHLNEKPNYVRSYLDKGLITKEEARSFALKALKKYPSETSYYFNGGLLTKEEALPFVPEALKVNREYITDYIKFGLITREEASQLALDNVKQNPFNLEFYVKAGVVTKEEALPSVVEFLKDYPSYLLRYVTAALITKKEARPLALAHLKRDPDYVDTYFRGELITREEALPFALKMLKYDPSELDRYRRLGILTKQDVNDFLSGHLSTSVNDFSHAHTLNLEILQKLRSLAKKSGGSITLDKTPQFKKFFSGKTSLSVADIDKMIAREQQQNKHNAYSFEHHIWDKRKMQNSFKQDQLVIKVSALPKALQSEIDSKEYLKKFMDYVKKNTTGHPSPYGWARVHVKKRGAWIIDEIQSDVVTMARSYLGSWGLEDHEAEIKAFASKHFADSMRKLILSAVTERAHKTGINKIEHMNVEFKARQNLSNYGNFGKDRIYRQDQHHQPIKVVDPRGRLVDTTKGSVKDSDRPLPAHYVDTYHEGPQKAGFERDESTGRWVKFSRRR